MSYHRKCSSWLLPLLLLSREPSRCREGWAADHLLRGAGATFNPCLAAGLCDHLANHLSFAVISTEIYSMILIQPIGFKMVYSSTSFLPTSHQLWPTWLVNYLLGCLGHKLPNSPRLQMTLVLAPGLLFLLCYESLVLVPVVWRELGFAGWFKLQRLWSLGWALN